MATEVDVAIGTNAESAVGITGHCWKTGSSENGKNSINNKNERKSSYSLSNAHTKKISTFASVVMGKLHITVGSQHDVNSNG